MDTETGSAEPRSPVSCTLRFRDHELVQDKPEASGGEDDGVMASELLLGALLACQLSTFAKVAVKRRLDAGVKRLDGTLHFDDAGDIERVHLDWVLITDAAEKDVTTALRLTDKACTISRCLSVPVDYDFAAE